MRVVQHFFASMIGLSMLVSQAHAQQVRPQSNNYRMPTDVQAVGGGEAAKSTNYLLDDTIGEANIGELRSDNYQLDAGYRQTLETYLAFGCDDTADMGTITFTGQANASANCTVTTDADAGYALKWTNDTGSGGTMTGHLINPNEQSIAPFAASNTDLAAHWRLDESTAGISVVDRSGNGNHGTPNGTGGPNNMPQPSASIPSNPNFFNTGSLYFDGVDDIVNTSLTMGTKFTWSAWFKIDSWSDFKSIITIEGGSYMLMDIISGAGSFWSPDSMGGATLGVNGLSTGTWYHLVFVREGDSTTNGYKAYLNGALTGQADTGVWSSPDPVSIGNRVGHSQSFEGNLDDIRLYNRPLSAAEIKALYGEPQDWSVPSSESGWGARLSSTSDDTDAKWGTDILSSKWLNIGDGEYTFVTRTTRTDVTGSDEIIQFRSEVGATKIQPTGLYQSTVTLTAVSL